jgi:hypothetical protein
MQKYDSILLTDSLLSRAVTYQDTPYSPSPGIADTQAQESVREETGGGATTTVTPLASAVMADPTPTRTIQRLCVGGWAKGEVQRRR